MHMPHGRSLTVSLLVKEQRGTMRPAPWTVLVTLLVLPRALSMLPSLDTMRFFGSDSGITRPETPRFSCKHNHTMYIRDYLKLPGKEQIFLTREGLNALMFLGPREALLVDGEGEKLRNRMVFDSCAVVGNGGILKLSAHGPAIDSHSVVFRTNQGPTKGYERQTGARTTFRVVNKHWLIKYSTGGPKWLPKERGMTLVMGRGEDDLIGKTFDYYTETEDLHTVKMGGAVGSRSRALLFEYRKRLRCLRGEKMEGGNTPTSGLYQVIMALSLCRDVTAYGFGDGAGRYQYYSFYNTERETGNVEVHSFSAEKSLIEQLQREGFLKFCTGKSEKYCGCKHPSGACPFKASNYARRQSAYVSASAAADRTGGPAVRIVQGGWAVAEENGSTLPPAPPPPPLPRYALTEDDLKDIMAVIGDVSKEAGSSLPDFLSRADSQLDTLLRKDG